MRQIFRVLSLFLVFFFLMPSVFAQGIEDFFNFGNYPVNYDPPLNITRGLQRPESIDYCLNLREFNFNELHSIWVENLARCKFNSKNVLSVAQLAGVSVEPKDEQQCVGRREGEIIVQGAPSEEKARDWSEHCSYLGRVGGVGPPGTNATDSNQTVRTGSSSFTVSNGGRSLGTPASSSKPKTNDGPVYRGEGIKVPDVSVVAGGISKETSLLKLIVFYTNVALPYVSVVSVFAFVAAGLFYILSFANEELNAKAKNMMTYVVIGIIIIFSAFTVVNTLLSFSSFQ